MKHFKYLFTILILTSVRAEVDPGSADAATQTTPARVLVEKRILNKYLVEGKDIVVNYHLYNVGHEPATEITVTDQSLSPEYFETVSGASNFAVPRLNPGENTSHTVVYRTKAGVWGRYNFTAAIVSYRPTVGAQFQVSIEPNINQHNN